MMQFVRGLTRDHGRVRVPAPQTDDNPACQVWVEQKSFCEWLQLGNLIVSEAVVRWWTELSPVDRFEDCDQQTVEEADLKCVVDDTGVKFFERLRVRVKALDPDGVRDGVIRFDVFQRWLEETLGADALGFQKREHLRAQLEFELAVVEEFSPLVNELGGL